MVQTALFITLFAIPTHDNRKEMAKITVMGATTNDLHEKFIMPRAL
jgi:hypothetical protein